MRTRASVALSLLLVGACAEEPGAPPAASAVKLDPQASPPKPSASVQRPPPPVALPPAVALDGSFTPNPVAYVGKGPRVYSRALRTWIHARPTKNSKRLGYLRAGASSPTSPEPASRAGCKGGWYPIQPEGFVCVGRAATLDGNDPIVVATREHPPDASQRLPYIYGTVRRPGPIYARLPDGEAMRKAEKGIDDRMERWFDAGGEIGASYAQHVWMGGMGDAPDPRTAWSEKRSEAVPSFLLGGAMTPNIRRTQRDDDAVTLGRMTPRVGHSFLYTMLHDGRRYGMTVDLRLMPTDRFRPIQGSSFHGWQIGKEIKFPFIIVRHPRAKFFLYQKSKNKLMDAGAAPYRGAFEITGKQKFFRKRLHYETKDGKWISDRHASRLDPAKRMPAWGKNGEKWMDVNLTKQTIVLYEGTKAVYATLISSGEAGLGDPKKTTATKRGIFRVHTKHISATMSSDEIGEEFELRDVPYVQYFDGEGYALHGAYWHDRFGTPKSHGCLNLVPEDARRIFHWTDPPVPPGWHGRLLPLKGTVIFIHP